MADFKTAYDITSQHEGGYVDHPADKGGETFRGIARNFHSDWEGWEIIDQKKQEAGFPGNLAAVDRLNPLVKDFYREKFWNPIKGNLFDNQAIANITYDISVNFGVMRGVQLLQKACEAIGRDVGDHGVDGAMGSDTLKSANGANSRLLLQQIVLEQLKGYERIISSNSSQQVFRRGWYNRSFGNYERNKVHL
jgi:lysozyme family protein